MDVFSWRHDSRSHAHNRRPACTSSRAPSRWTSSLWLFSCLSARPPGDTRMFLPRFRVRIGFSCRRRWSFYVLPGVACSLESRTCFYFSSECCQLTCIRDLSKMGQKKGERKAQCDCLFFNELFVRVGRGECVCVCVCVCVLVHVWHACHMGVCMYEIGRASCRERV